MYNSKNGFKMKLLEKVEKINGKILDVATDVAITSLGISVVIWGGKSIKRLFTKSENKN